MVYQPSDLGAVEIALLGVLSVGLPPSRSADDDTFRVDHVTAVVAGLHAGNAAMHLEADSVRVSGAFRAELRAAIESLAAREIVADAMAGMPAAPGGFEAGLEIDLVNPDEHPALLDRYLAQQCMEQLFEVAAIYPYLMERYAKSGEVWRRLRAGGYAP